MKYPKIRAFIEALDDKELANELLDLLGSLEDKSKSAQKGSRLPSDWELPEEWGEWAETQGLSFDQVCTQEEAFRDFWHSKPGAGGVKLDWQATWRNWIRRSREF